MEKGELPWEKNWIKIRPENATTGKRYNGMNLITLTHYANKAGYTDPRWCTFKQAKDAGWSVKGGEKATFIEYWDWYKKIPALDSNGKQLVDENGKKVFDLQERERPICVSHAVFNAAQIDGIPPYEKQVGNKWNSVETAENILTNSGAVIEHKQSDRAFYRPSTDSIVLPLREQFKSTEGYYGTALHELSHWTGHPTRLNRDMTGEFGSPEYAKEELRAELSSAFLNSELGIRKEFSHSAAYLQSWIQALKNDKDEIYRAAGAAEKITNYILEFAKEKELTQKIEGGKTMDVKVNENQAEQAQSDTLLGHLKEGVKEELKKDILAEDTLLGYAANNIKDDLKSFAGTEGTESKKVQDIAGGKPALCDIRLNVAFEQSASAKELGAKWDKEAKAWYAPKGEDLSKFSAYLPQSGKMYALRDTRITVDYNERAAAKEKGAWWDGDNKQWFIPKGEDVTKFEQKYFKPAPEKVKNITKTFEDFARERGLIIDGRAVGDGSIQRVPVEGGKPGSKDGMYILHDDDRGRAGYVQNFKSGGKGTFAERGIEFTLSETDKAIIAEGREKHIAEIQAKQALGAKTATYLIKHKFTAAEANHPYLQAKGIEPHSARKDTGGKLIVPLKNINGEIRSFQVIDDDGNKHFMTNGQKVGCFHQIGDIKPTSKDIIICEGFATGASLNEATKMPVLCTMDSGNLKSVSIAVREKYGDKVNIIIAGDNDHKTENNPGKTAAEAAAQAVNGKAITPEFTPKEKEQGLTDFNDLAASRGKSAVKEQLSTAMNAKSRQAEREMSLA
jgi:antirestriction protein ArdC/phage/plasmid primase-like uncharacterized protein